MTIRRFLFPVLCAVLFFFANPFVRSETYPVGICLSGIPGTEFPGPDDAVCGLRFGLFGRHRRMDGLSILLFGNDVLAGDDPADGKDGSAGGVQLASFLNLADETDGLLVQIAGFGNGIGKGFALQASIFINEAGLPKAKSFFLGVQASLVSNHSFATEGGTFQIAAGNTAKELAGMQLGAINFSERGSGIQAGVYNECAGHSFWTDSKNNQDAGDEPVFNGVQIGGINRAHEANGFQIGVVDWADKSSSGIQFGAVNWTPSATGFQVGAINATENADGVQLGAVNWADSVSGLQIGGFNRTETLTGVQLGAANLARGDCFGVQLGAVNLAGYLHGLQLGAFNLASSGCQGAQIGLINIYSGNRANISAVQFGGINAAGGSAVVVLPVLRIVF